MSGEHVTSWFAAWLKQHKASNPHNGWASFESAGPALVYLGWIRAFVDLGVTRAEAEAASLRLQRSGEVWPVDHLARLLAYLSPVVAARRADRESARRRDESAEWAARQEVRRAFRDAFRELPPAEVDRRLASIRDRYPSLAPMPAFVELFAVAEWRGSPLPEPPPVGETPALATTIGPAPEPDEPPLTAGQAALVAALAPEQAAALGAISPGKRGLLLAPFAERFDPTLLPLVAAELPAMAPVAAEVVAA